MNRPGIIALWIALAVMLSVPAWAQVRQVTGGNALDRNLQVGGGGVNQPVNRVNFPNSELVATGQVTGLAGFSGMTLVAPNELRITPPSAALDTFLGQSVGVQQAANNMAYSPTAFFSPSRTVMDVPRGNFATTPSSYAVPAGSPAATAAVIQRAYADVRQLYDAALPAVPQPGRRDDIQPQYTIMPMDLNVTPGLATVERRQQESLARDLVAAQIALRDSTPGADIADPLVPLTLNPNRNRAGDEAQRTTGKTPRKNQDVFVDILIALQRERDADARLKPSRTDDAAAGLFPPDPDQDDALVGVEDNQVIIHGLAGQSQDMFNQFMARGQAGLKAGRYYEAARSFELATILNDANPTAAIGQGLALFGAGEFYSASNMVRRAMDAFPPIMETRLDLAGMMSKDDLERRIKELRERTALDERAPHDEADTPLLLLAAFMAHNAGDTKAARAYAARLAARDDAKPVVRLYAIYLTTGKIPQSLPESATQPAAPTK